jgi:hypothetical protein
VFPRESDGTSPPPGGTAEGARDDRSVPTTWDQERDVAFFGITEALAADGFADDTVVFARDELAAQIDKVLQDLLVAESWESMAVRSVGRSRSDRRRDLVPVPARSRTAGS